MLSVRNTGLVVFIAIRARRTKTRVVSEWGLEMFSEGGENCLRDSRTNSAMLRSPISREQCILPFPTRSHAFYCPVCVKHFLVPPHSFVPCDKNLIVRTLCIFFVPVLVTSIIYKLVVSLQSLVCCIVISVNTRIGCGDAFGR